MKFNYVHNDYIPITGASEGSFARFTLENRLPSIIEGILAENLFSPEVNADLQKIKHKILHGALTIPIITGPDQELWKIWMAPYLHLTWFEAPFYVVESYFYRLILDATGFFSNNIDPFFNIKRKDIDEHISQLSELLIRLEDVKEDLDQSDLIHFILQLSLWGNKSDLSQSSLDRNVKNATQKSNIIIDHSAEIIEMLSREINSIAIILDNSGMELFTDLLLARELASLNKNVVLLVKAYPTFVSDATEKDIMILLNAMAKSNDELLVKFCNEIHEYMEHEKITISTNVFWNSPLHFYEMPANVTKSLNDSELIIVKGDANYRRVFGDRVIPRDTNPKLMTGYLPAKCVAIRILKSEIITGLQPGEITHFDSYDHNWMINGKYGIIQFLN